jgi:dihydroorotase-like cyclic amidohydrolase
MLIRNTKVVNFDDLSILESVDVKIRGNLIESIGKIEEVDNETIDGSRYIVTNSIHADYTCAHFFSYHLDRMLFYCIM